MRRRIDKWVRIALIFTVGILWIPLQIEAQDRIERAIQRYESPRRARWQKPDDVVRALQLRPGMVVVDIGAGTGYFTRRFARVVGPEGRAIGLDIEPRMVAYMREDAHRRGLTNYEARLVRADDPGLPDAFADVIFLCNTYHHIQNRVRYFRNIRHALKPGGRLVIVDFYRDRNIPVAPPKWMRVARDQVVRELNTAGYRLLREHTFLPYQYFLEFVVAGGTGGDS